jgi:hypothetical protein
VTVIDAGVFIAERTRGPDTRRLRRSQLVERRAIVALDLRHSTP